MTAESDAMHGVLVQRADVLEGYPDGSDEEVELKAIVDAIEAYEAVLRSLGARVKFRLRSVTAEASPLMPPARIILGNGLQTRRS
jgi:hypothetical protein